jgi:gas vesicle protein
MNVRSLPDRINSATGRTFRPMQSRTMRWKRRAARSRHTTTSIYGKLKGMVMAKKKDTALGTAMEKAASTVTLQSRAYVEAYNILQDRDYVTYQVTNEMFKLVQNDPGLMIGILGEDRSKEEITAFLKMVIKDMGKQVSEPVNAGEEEKSEAHESCESHRSYGPSSPTKSTTSLSESIRTHGHQFVSDKSRKKALLAAHTEAAKTIMDTYKIRDGRSIGDIQFLELEGIRSANAQEAALIKLIMRHASNVDPVLKVRDVIKIDVLQGMIQKAAEAADVF